jgi:hypothetical protein
MSSEGTISGHSKGREVNTVSFESLTILGDLLVLAAVDSGYRAIVSITSTYVFKAVNNG